MSAFQGDAFQGDAFQAETGVSLGLINQAAVANAPTITTGAVNVSLGLIDRTATAHAPSVAQTQSVAVGLIDQTAVANAPTISTGAVSVSLGLITQTAVAYAPTVSAAAAFDPAFQGDAFQNDAFQVSLGAVYVGSIDQTAVAFSPNVSYNQTVALGLIDQTAVAYTPTVSSGQSVSLGLIDQTATPFSPTVLAISAIDLGSITQTAVAFTPALSYAQDLALGLIDRTSEAFDPVVDLSGVQTLALGRITQTAVAFDPELARPVTRIGSVESIRTNTANPFSFTGNTGVTAGSGNNYQTGFVVSIVMSGAGGNMVTGVTFGDVAMTEIATAQDPTGEEGFASLWFCVPQQRGGQTVTYTLTSATTNDFQVVAMAFTSEHDLEVIDSDSISGDTANPSVVLTTGGKLSLAVAAMFSGLDVPSGISELGTMTLVHDHDFGAASAEVAAQTTRGTSNFTAGFTSASDDVAFVALLLAEGINKTVGVGLISQTATISAPTVTQAGAGVTLGLIDQTAVAFSIEVGTIALPLIDQTAVAFSPTIFIIAVDVDLISQPASAFAPTITTGVTTILLGLIVQTAIARPPLVSLTTEVGGGGGTGGPGTSTATSHTRVFIAGIGNVAPIVIWSQSILETAEGGEASAGIIVIRDVGIDRAEFTPMARVTIDRGAGTDPIYSGYLIKPSRRFFFPVDYPDTLQRMWVLNVADINLLWSRRVVYNRADPADVEGPQYVTDTWDDVALRELFDNWVDLSGDDLDVTTRINRVGLINYDQPAYPFNGGETLGDAVNTIAQLPAAVYGINSNRQVVYADVDDENAPFVLTDAPVTGGWEPVGSPGKPNAGYREMTLLEDGTNLCNDVMAWGFGMGAPLGVFKRLKDLASQAEHGLWQVAHVIYAVYKQATINKVADSVINGSPMSKRGQKNDAISVELVTFEDGLHVGDRVRFISHIWQYEDVIPVRKIEISFPTPDAVRYKFRLSHEIDRWGFQDPLPPFPLPGPYPVPNIPPIKIVDPPPVLPPSCVGGTYTNTEFTSNASDTGPFSSTDRHWGSPWVSILPPGGAPYATSASTSGVTTNVARVKVNNAEWGVRLPFSASSPLNRDVVTGVFNFRLVTTLPTSAKWQITYGPVTVEFDRALDEVRVTTGSGTTTESWTDWFTVATTTTASPSYNLEVALDLPNNEVRVRLSHPSTATTLEITRAADGERVGEGSYRPDISLYFENLTATDFQFLLNAIRSTVYSDGTVAASGDGLFDFTDSAWVQYANALNVPEVDPGIDYGSDGTIELVDLGTWESGSIRREVSGGSLNLGFGIYDYSTVNFKGSLLQLFFSLNAAGTSNRNTVNIGSSTSVTYGNSNTSNSGGSNTLFNAGDPVNAKIEFGPGALRLKVWAGGTAEPSAWTAQVIGSTPIDPWPNIFISVSGDNGFNDEGDHQRLGPLLLDTGEVPAYAMTGPTSMAFPSGADNDLPPSDDFGRTRRWPFTAPPGGGYAAPFATDQWLITSEALPTYTARMAWPTFFPTMEAGIFYEVFQEIASLELPPVTVEGVEIDYNVRIRGTITVATIGFKREDLGATGIPGRVNGIIERFDYGFDPTDPTPPTYTDYNVEQGEDVWNFIFENVQVGAPESLEFNVLMAPVLDEGTNIKHLQWGFYIHGIDETLEEAIRMAGPLWGGAFGSPNNGGMSISVSNPTYEFIPSALGFPAVEYSIDPCAPNPVGYDYGTPESGRICINFTGTGTGDEFDLPKFEPGSADVIVDGYTLTPGTNYTEDEDHLGVTIPIPPPDGAWVLICVTVM